MLSCAGGAVLAVAGDHEEGVVDADAEPDQAGDRDGGDRDVHGAGQQGDGADAGAHRDQREPDREDGGDQRCRTRRAARPGRRAGRCRRGWSCSSSALRNTASPPSSTRRPSDASMPETRVGEDREGGLAHLALGDVEGELGVPDACRPAEIGAGGRTGRRPPRRGRGRRRRSSTWPVTVACWSARVAPHRPRGRPGAPCPWPPRGSSRRPAAVARSLWLSLCGEVVGERAAAARRRGRTR